MGEVKEERNGERGKERGGLVHEIIRACLDSRVLQVFLLKQVKAGSKGIARQLSN
jgi:hypothetical protein